MVPIDMANRVYTVEVLRCRDVEKATSTIQRLFSGKPTLDVQDELKVVHGYVESETQFHRSRFLATDERVIPKTRKQGKKTFYLYDAILAAKKPYVLVAVPFYWLARDFFVMVDRALAGQRAQYERVDITRTVVALSAREKTGVADIGRRISVTKCQLAYEARDERARGLQNVRLAGEALELSPVYQHLIQPVIKRTAQSAAVTPLLLGITLRQDGIKKSGALTDRHGNFKVWVGVSPYRIGGLFDLLDSLSDFQDVRSTTSNLPILLSRTISDDQEVES